MCDDEHTLFPLAARSFELVSILFTLYHNYHNNMKSKNDAPCAGAHCDTASCVLLQESARVWVRRAHVYIIYEYVHTQRRERKYAKS